MFEGLGRFCFKRRRWVLAGALGFVAVAVLWGFGVFDTLSDDGIGADSSSESYRAQERAAAELGRDTSDIVVLYNSGSASVDDPAYRAAVEADLQALPGSAVAGYQTYWSTGAPSMASTDQHSTFAIVELSGADEEARETSYELVIPDIQSAPTGFTAKVGGGEAIGEALGTQVENDIVTAEIISFPVLLILLVLIFGGLIAASLPLAIGALAVLGSFTALRLITMVTDVSVFSINIVTMLGLGLAIDYALFVVSRFREELRVDGDVERSLVATMRTAGRTVAFSGVTVAVSLASLVLFPQLFLRSMAIGGVTAVLMAMIGSLTVLPALLAVLGPRINKLKIPLHRQARAQHRKENPGFWYRTARSVMRRPVIYIAVIVPGLLVLALPFLGVNFGQEDYRVLPAGNEARTVSEVLAQEFPGTGEDPINAVITFQESVSSAATAAEVQQYRDGLQTVPGVLGTEITGSAGNTVRVAVDHNFDPQSEQAKMLVTDIRAVAAPPDSEVLVGGNTAELVDMLASLGSRLPWMALWIVTATLILLFLAFGSVVLPIKAVLMNILSLTASFGAIVWIFQDGNFSGFLNFTVTGSIDSSQPILMLAIAFGLSMDYEVFLLSRIRESWDETGDNATAVAVGLQRTGAIITSAALLLIVVFAAFSTSGITFIKMIGVGMVLAILIDATVVRSLLVPASMQLLGKANWWAPAPLARFWQRHGWHEEGNGSLIRQQKPAEPTRHRHLSRQDDAGSLATRPMIDLSGSAGQAPHGQGHGTDGRRPAGASPEIVDVPATEPTPAGLRS